MTNDLLEQLEQQATALQPRSDTLNALLRWAYDEISRLRFEIADLRDKDPRCVDLDPEEEDIIMQVIDSYDAASHDARRENIAMTLRTLLERLRSWDNRWSLGHVSDRLAYFVHETHMYADSQKELLLESATEIRFLRAIESAIRTGRHSYVTLTRAEIRRLQRVIAEYEQDRNNTSCMHIAATLRSLCERLGFACCD